MTELPLVLDADVVSSFACVDRLDILTNLFAKHMVMLEEVLVELRKVEYIARRVDSCIQNGSIRLISVPANAPEASELADLLESGRYGRGEAACLAYLKYNFGSLASNNLSDVKAICSEKNIDLFTVPVLINYAFEKGAITEEEADTVWKEMIKKRRKLPTDSFRDFLAIGSPSKY